MLDINSAPRGPGARVRLEPDGRSFTCAPGQTLLAGALSAGIDLPYECASGTCGSCRSQLASGEVRSRWPAAPGLSERDRRKGDRILCCQSVPDADCTIRVRAQGAGVRVLPVAIRAIVRSARRLNADMLHLVLDSENRVDFLPGQFMLFESNRYGWRAYSMCNVPDASGRLEFLVKRKPGGQVSGFLFDELAPGASLRLEGPYGRAWLREDSMREIVLLAGGSGLAPVWSIAQAALARSADRSLRLYFGANRARDLFWLPEMQLASRRHPGLRINVLLMEPSAGDPPGCRQGSAGAALAAEVNDLAACDLYMAGPPGLIDHAMRELVSTGRAAADRVFYDRFY